MNFSNQITRVAAYGVVSSKGKTLLVKQKRGPYAGKFDFAGGGLEFGESVEEALRREFVEEVAMVFDSMQWVANLTATVEVPQAPSNTSYQFYQIGMIYQLEGCRPMEEGTKGGLKHYWVDLKMLSEDECSKLLWKFIQLDDATHNDE